MENLLNKCPDKICRTCFCESEAMKSLNTKIEGGQSSLLELLSFVVNIRVITKENQPAHVCNLCEEIICKAAAFKRRCYEVESILGRSEDVQGCSELFLQESVLKHEKYFSEPGDGKVSSTAPETKENSLNIFNDDDEKPLALFYNRDDGLNHCLNHSDLKGGLNELSLSDIKEESDGCSDVDTYPETLELPIEFNVEGLVIKKIQRDSKKEKSKTKPKKGVKTDTESTSPTCPECHKTFSTKKSLNRHKKLHPNLIKQKEELDKLKGFKICKYTCFQCDKSFQTLKYLNKHKRRHEKFESSKTEDGTKFNCSLCMRSFKNHSKITAHLKLHEEKLNIKNICQTCHREFQHKAHLDNHILSVHTRDSGYLCSICSRNFTTQESLDVHKESHAVKKNHSCTICNKAFIMLSTLTDHMRTHTGEKPYLCSFCGRGFSQKTNLAQHVRRHQGLKPFACDQCDLRFVSKGELDAHSRTHSGAHPFICDDCGGGFTTASSLKKHRRIHTGERPYACDFCSMTFAASGTLKNHRRTHTGEKPFKCIYCEKAFVQRHDLISHIRTHTGERPYTCQCNQAFRKASSLKAHIKMHEKDPRDGIIHTDTTVMESSSQHNKMKERNDVLLRHGMILPTKDEDRLILSKRNTIQKESTSNAIERDSFHKEDSQRGQSIFQRDQSISQRDQSLSQRDQSVSFHKADSLRGQSILQRDQSILQRDQSLSQRDQSVSQRDQSILDRDLSIVQKGVLRDAMLFSAASLNLSGNQSDR